MKKSEIQELKKWSAPELGKLLLEKRERLRALTVDQGLGKSTQLKELRELKKTVARIHTYLNALPKTR